MNHVVIVGPVRLQEPSTHLGCVVVRTIGYSWKCRCGARGTIKQVWREARAEGMEHTEHVATEPS